MSADVLRQAATLMRERAEKATSGPWEFRPRRGFQSVGQDPATIGFVDTAGYFVMLREGTWTTECDMAYVASWHPAVALAVADWLVTVAERQIDSANTGAILGGTDWEAALAVARTYLGSDQ